MKAAFYTLGCKVNQYETQALEQLLSRRGHTIVPFEQDADVYVINTCSVTAASDRKSRQLLRRVRREHPYAVLAVCGCFPQTHPDELPELDADVIAGTGDRTGFVSLLEQAFQNKSAGLGCYQMAVDKRGGNLNSFPPDGWKTVPAPCSKLRTALQISVLTA